MQRLPPWAAPEVSSSSRAASVGPLPPAAPSLSSELGAPLCAERRRVLDRWRFAEEACARNSQIRRRRVLDRWRFAEEACAHNRHIRPSLQARLPIPTLIESKVMQGVLTWESITGHCCRLKQRGSKPVASSGCPGLTGFDSA